MGSEKDSTKGSENTAAFQDALSRGHQLARAGKWSEATKLYKAAVTALPSDVLARTCLAQSLYNSGNLSDALQEYERLLQTSPKDILLLTRMAEIHRKLGAAHEATDLYLRAAEVHLDHKRKEKAQDIWRMIARNYGENLGCLERLSRSCSKAGDKQLEAEAVLAIAHVYAEIADQRQAVRACRRAIDLDRSNALGQRMLASLENGTNEWRSFPYLERFFSDIVVPDASLEPAKAPSEAPGKAIQDDPEYSTSGMPHAEDILDEEIQLASARAAEAILEDAEQFRQAGDTVSALAVLCAALDKGLPSNGVVASVAEERIRSLSPSALKLSLAELASLPLNSRRIVIGGMLTIEDYLAQDLVVAAEDTCLEVIEEAPEYLPAQSSLAEIYVRQGHLDAAKEKYSCIVRLCEVRGESSTAARTRARLVSLFSDDGWDSDGLANTLIELGDVDAALHQMMKVADRLLELGDGQGCLNQLEKMLHVAPGRLDIELRFAQVAEKMGRIVDANTSLERAVANHPYSRDAILAFICLKVKVDEWVMPDQNVEWFFQLLLTDRDLAPAALERMSAIEPTVSDKPEFKLCMGAILQVLGRLDDSRRSLLGAIGQNDYLDVIARYFLSMALAGKGDLKSAVEQLKTGLPSVDVSERPQTELNETNWLRLGYLKQMRSLFRRLGDEQCLLKVLEELKQAAPEDHEVSQEIVDLYFRANQPDLALKELSKLAGSRTSREDLKQAVTVYRELVDRYPKNPIVRKLLSAGCESLGLNDECATHLEAAVQFELADSQRAEAAKDIRHLIDLYRVTKPERALQWREQLAKLTPGDVNCRTDLVDAYLRMGFPAKSLTEARALARELISQENREDAIPVLQNVLNLDPWDVWALEQLGVSFDKTGRFQDSIKTYQRLIAIDPDNAIARVRLAGPERR